MVTVIERTQTGRRTLVHSCRLSSKFLESALVQMELKQGALVSSFCTSLGRSCSKEYWKNINQTVMLFV